LASASIFGIVAAAALLLLAALVALGSTKERRRRNEQVLADLGHHRQATAALATDNAACQPTEGDGDGNTVLVRAHDTAGSRTDGGGYAVGAAEGGGGGGGPVYAVPLEGAPPPPGYAGQLTTAAAEYAVPRARGSGNFTEAGAAPGYDGCLTAATADYVGATSLGPVLRDGAGGGSGYFEAMGGRESTPTAYHVEGVGLLDGR